MSRAGHPVGPAYDKMFGVKETTMTRSRIHPRILLATAVASVLLAVAPGAPARAATAIKLATLVPDGSVWDLALKEMGAEWQRVTNGDVTLRIYPGGVAGDDSDIVRKIRIGQLQAGALTVAGLAEIDPAFNALAIPLFFDSYDELFFVIDRLEPMLSAKLEAQGFQLLNWGHGGWAHFFSKEPITSVEDLQRMKIFTWAGDQRMVEWWKSRGFQPVPLAMTDIPTGLQTGMIDALPTTPLAALSLQWFRQTPYMHSLGLAPVVGAVVVSTRAWEKLPADQRAAMLEAARAAGKKLQEEVPVQDERAIEEMKSRGLTVTGGEEAVWRSEGQTFADSMRGKMVSPEVFDQVLAARTAFRESRQP